MIPLRLLHSRDIPAAQPNPKISALLNTISDVRLRRRHFPPAPALPIVFVAFNCEEDSLRGSRDFAESFLPNAPFKIRCAHHSTLTQAATYPPDLPVTGLAVKLGLEKLFVLSPQKRPHAGRVRCSPAGRRAHRKSPPIRGHRP